MKVAPNVDAEKSQDVECERMPLFHWHSMRLYILLLMCLCAYCGTSMKSSLGVAVVCMVNKTSTTPESHSANSHAYKREIFPSQQEDERTLVRCVRVKINETRRKFVSTALHSPPLNQYGYDGTLRWTPTEQFRLFSSLFYGNMVTIGFSGWLADRYSPKWLLAFAIANCSFFNMLTPWMANSNYYVYLGARFVMGLGDGLLFPCLGSLVARWFPRSEKATAAAIYTSGIQIAATLGVLISTKLCTFNWFLVDGWPNIFYAGGLIGIVWLILWLIFTSDHPADAPFINQKEKLYLDQHLPAMVNKKLTSKSIPWLAMLTSSATISVILCQFSFNFSNTLLQGFMPTYFRDVLLLDLDSNGLYTAMPFIIQLVFKNALAIFADYLKRSGRVGATMACKILQTLSAGGSCLALLAMAWFVDCETPALALMLLAVFGMCFAGSVAGAFTAALCIAPPFTGTISSLSLFSGAIGNIAVSSLVGYVHQYSTRREWAIIFLIAAAVNLITGLFFIVYGTAAVQPWANNHSNNKAGENKRGKNDGSSDAKIFISGMAKVEKE